VVCLLGDVLCQSALCFAQITMFAAVSISQRAFPSLKTCQTCMLPRSIKLPVSVVLSEVLVN